MEFQNILITLKENLHSLAVIPSHVLSPPLSPLATTNLLFLSMDFHILDISYKWNHAICVLF